MRRAGTGKKAPESVEKTLLKCAAELILKTAHREIDIKELAEMAKVPRSNLYTFFGKGRDVKEGILVAIFNEFLAQAATMIEGAVASIDPRAASPIERLTAVFRATMASFRRDPLFGNVVLAKLDLQQKNEAALVYGIFERVDNLIREARNANQLAPELAKRLTDSKIRQLLFVLTRGLLRGVYLPEQSPVTGRGGTAGALSEKDVEIEVLRVLAIYCSKEAAEKIQKTIEAIAA